MDKPLRIPRDALGTSACAEVHFWDLEKNSTLEPQTGSVGSARRCFIQVGSKGLELELVTKAEYIVSQNDLLLECKKVRSL